MGRCQLTVEGIRKQVQKPFLLLYRSLGLQWGIELHFESCGSILMQWQPTREGYLQYLAESQAVYAAMEKIMKDAPVDSCERPTSV